MLFSEDVRSTGLICLESVQQEVQLEIHALFRSLNQFSDTLQGIGLTHYPLLGCFICLDMKNRLLWSRVELKRTEKLDVKVIVKVR